jgi:hypothetical protein
LLIVISPSQCCQTIRMQLATPRVKFGSIILS